METMIYFILFFTEFFDVFAECSKEQHLFETVIFYKTNYMSYCHF